MRKGNFTRTSFLAAVAWALTAAAANAQSPDLGRLGRDDDKCKDGQHLQVTLGLPTEYSGGPEPFGTEAPTRDGRQVCGVIAVGTPYQVLSWLENGGVQAAVLSSFSVAVMKADDPERFARDFYDFPTSALSNLPRYERRILMNHGSGDAVDNPAARLVDFFAAVHSSSNRPTVLLSSHLSPAVPYLIREAIKWSGEKQLKRSEREDFYQTLLTSIRFGAREDIQESTTPPPTYELVDTVAENTGIAMPHPVNELPARVLGDRVVVRKRVLLASRNLREYISGDREPADRSDELREDRGLIAETAALDADLGPTLTAFRNANYSRLQLGYISQRHFRFTIPELWSQLRRMDKANDTPEKMALVLTGGGVKAAYQTRMIDYLYDEQRLVNAGSKADRKATSQQVDFVIGTSGGALLGVFVAGMTEQINAARRSAPEKNLTAVLWKNPGTGIRSYDVFPFLDMMRYATLIVALIVVSVVAGWILEVWRKPYPQVTRFAHTEDSFFARRGRAWRETWPWIVVLLLAPIIIVKVAAVNRVEHMPTETGLYYAWMALVAFYADIRLTPIKPFKWLKARYTWKAGALIGTGLLCIVLAWLRPMLLRELPGFGENSIGFVNLCCAGFVLLLHGVQFFFSQQTGVFRNEPRRPIFQAFFVLLGIVLLSYLAVTIAMWFEATSLLEMNAGFWVYFLGFAALFTALLMWLGRAPDAAGATSLPQSTVGYLFSEYHSRALIGSQRRFMRFMSLTVLAWVWWNVLAAPALYGNLNARAYLDSAFTSYSSLVQPAAAPPAKNGDQPFELAVPFVITATSLEKGQERYFLFISGNDDKIDEALTAQAWFRVVRDPRWVVVRQPVDTELQDAAFASGSPFPVFSAHAVQLRGLRGKENKEVLIDGGFAHNRPLEAALDLGARKVLVINSSPLADNAAPGRCTVASLSLGELACNLPKLLPYLWERSQVEDLLSTRRMVVASIYPTTPDGTWPSLTDFRSETVSKLVGSAQRDHDEQERVGVIESWGAPDFSEPGLFRYDADQIKYALTHPAS